MKYLLLFFIVILHPAVAGIQPVDFTKEVVKTVNKAINDNDDPFQTITSYLNFSIDKSDRMPGARSGWVYTVPTIIFTSSLSDVIFYMAELDVLSLLDEKWNNCSAVYGTYLRSAYMEMMAKKNDNQPLSPLIPPERFGGSCEGIENHYPFSGKEKIMRDQKATNAIAFIYLHELSHLYYKHVKFNTENMGNEQRQEANCTLRMNEKQADLLAARKMVKFGWYASAMDTTVWSVMLNTGIMETSRNSDLSHPTALERMTYTLDEVRGAILESGGHVSREMSEGIDEAIALVKKADEQMGLDASTPAVKLRCDN